MTTRASREMVGIYTAVERSGQYPSMDRRAGIVGDAAHARRATYHISREDQPYTSGNYTIQAPADKRGPSNLSSAIDMKMNPRDMRKMTTRLMNACKANHANPASEPRIECLREFQGTLDGRRVIGWNRYATGDGSRSNVGYITGSNSHLWHIHAALFRDYADDKEAIAGLIEILLGIPLSAGPPLPEGDDMPSLAEIWGYDINPGEGEHDPAWYLREIHKIAKASSERERELPGLIEQAVAPVRADLAAIRAELASFDDDDQAEPTR
jgi:hypothetical protein